IVTLRRAGKLVAATPAYVKLHSQGEFVFDFAFADLASRAGVRYYPKLLAAVPFTPVTGRRFLTLPGADRASLVGALARALLELSKELGCSGTHVNFCVKDEIDALVAAGFEERHGVQYHWYRRGALRFDDYLSRFNSKKRNQVKREVRAVSEQGMSIEV